LASSYSEFSEISPNSLGLPDAVRDLSTSHLRKIIEFLLELLEALAVRSSLFLSVISRQSIRKRHKGVNGNIRWLSVVGHQVLYDPLNVGGVGRRNHPYMRSVSLGRPSPPVA
jgi:hypothetical protein